MVREIGWKLKPRDPHKFIFKKRRVIMDIISANENF